MTSLYPDAMQIHRKANLKPFHTFAIDVTCEYLVIVNSLEELSFIYRNPEWKNLPKLLLGKGSNVLFSQHFCGVVIINRLCGIDVSETDEYWHLHVNGGEDWPDFVKWSLDNSYDGLENLGLIPGCAGSAPIQNIGAYGVEFKDVCEYVEVLNIETLAVSKMDNHHCRFGYRDSVFKKELKGKVAIIAVGIKLPKIWNPVVHYGGLKAIPNDERTAKRIFLEVCRTRMNKLPDPCIFGNAGSFFKNPIISKVQFNKLKARYSDVVAYSTENGMKVAAGWLIDHCGLKGEMVGGAMVHQEQALVLMNYNNATSDDIIELAMQVRTFVFDKYQILLEHEVRFFNSVEETSLDIMGNDK